jgi:hypothetical protein
MYLRALFWTTVFIGRLVFESLSRPFFDLIVFAGSVRGGSGGVRWRDWGNRLRVELRVARVWVGLVYVHGDDRSWSLVLCIFVRKVVLFSPPVFFFLSKSFGLTRRSCVVAITLCVRRRGFGLEDWMCMQWVVVRKGSAWEWVVVVLWCEPFLDFLALVDCECCWRFQVMSRCRWDMVMLERLVAMARVQFALLPVGASDRTIAHVFRRMMRRRRYLRTLRVRTLAVERLMRVRRAAEFRVRVRAWGGKLGGCFGGDRQLRMEVAKTVDVVPKLLTLVLPLFLGGFLGVEETGVEEEPWPYVGYPLSYDPPLRPMRPSAIDGIRAEYAIRPVWYGNVLFVRLSCLSALMKLPSFCVYINGLGGVGVVVGSTV